VVVFGGALAACGGGSSGRSQKAFCDALKKDQAFFSDLSDSSDFNSDQSQSLAINALDDLAKKAPNEIKDDVAKVAQFAKDATSNKTPSISTSDLTKATTNVDNYAKDKCGIDLSASGSSSNSSSSRSSNPLSDLSNLSDLSDLSKLSDFSDFSDLSSLSGLTSNFSDLSSLTDLSSLDSVFSSLRSLFSS
jgi:hypothetical protein